MDNCPGPAVGVIEGTFGQQPRLAGDDHLSDYGKDRPEIQSLPRGQPSHVVDCETEYIMPFTPSHILARHWLNG